MTRQKTAVLALAAFAVCYAGVIVDLAERWATSEVYSYGVAVVLISGYMIWTKSERLHATPSAPDYVFGIPLTLAGLAMLVAGRVSFLTSLREASLIVTLWGFVLLVFGRAIFACLWFPLCYLLLGFPLWDSLIGWLQPPSQVLSGRIATGLLHAIGVPALQDGTKIALPTVTLEVLRECSGVNQLFAVVAMALPAGYVWLSGWRRRTVLVALAVVGAYVSNGVRIAIVGFLATRGLSNGDLRGVHLFEGLAVSALCYLLLLVCLSILSRGQRPEESGAPIERSLWKTPSLRGPWPQVLTLVAAISIGVFVQLFRTPDVGLRRDLRALPVQVGDWSLDAQSVPSSRFPAIDDELVHAYPSPAGERRFAAADDELVRTYRNSAGERVQLYVGYHRSQREGKELLGEAARALNTAASAIELDLGSRTLQLKQVTPQPDSRRGVLYWYDLNGRVVDDLFLVKGYMVWDAMTRRRSNGAVVMVAWDGRGGRDAESSRKGALDFAQTILPLLPNFIPS
jgi:EpsI family protein